MAGDMPTSPKLYACAFALLTIAAAAKEKPAAMHWVATWAASPSAPGTDTEMRRRKMEFDNQTVRLIAHISLGGERFRVRLANFYGTKALAIGEVHLALRGTGPKIQPGSDRPLTFSGNKAIAIPAGGQVLSDPVDLKAAAASDLAVSLFLPPGPVIAR